jgi:hypothetical protein
MDGVVSPGRRGRRCHSSSVRNGMKGCIMSKPLSSAVYKVSSADRFSCRLPCWIMAFEFSMKVSQRLP